MTTGTTEALLSTATSFTLPLYSSGNSGLFYNRGRHLPVCQNHTPCSGFLWIPRRQREWSPPVETPQTCSELLKSHCNLFFFFFFWWTFKLVWWTSKGTCVILNYDFDSFYFSILMAGVRHPRIFHHKLREFNLEKQKMKRAFWKSRYLWLLKSTDAFVPRKELQLCLMSFFLNKCVYTFYALVPAWIKIISLSALNLTFFFFGGGYGCRLCLRPQNVAPSGANGWRARNSTTVFGYSSCVALKVKAK